jgi:hypothetical protein
MYMHAGKKKGGKRMHAGLLLTHICVEEAIFVNALLKYLATSTSFCSSTSSVHVDAVEGARAAQRCRNRICGGSLGRRVGRGMFSGRVRRVKGALNAVSVRLLPVLWASLARKRSGTLPPSPPLGSIAPNYKD